jgi:MFS family permease
VSRDTTWAVTSTVAFSFALSLSSVALPLLALAAGYSLTAIGVLTACSAVSQLGIRLVLGSLMRRYPDWVLVMMAALTMAGSTAVVAVSADVVPFVLCQLAHGVARGAFWTGSQTHVVRREGSVSRALAKVNFASTGGHLFGPLVAGILAERSLAAALLLSSGVAVLAGVASLFFDRLPPFEPVITRPAGRLWRRPGVDLGCWSGVTTGGWRGLLNSYVPVALAGSHTATTVGVLISVANGAALAGAGIIGRLPDRAMRRSFAPVTVLCGVTTGVLAFVAPNAVLAATLLAASGATLGMLQVVGPAIAVSVVDPQERGDVIAVTGTFRALALLVSPLAVAGLLGVVSLGPAMAVVGLAIAVPAVFGRRIPD